MITTSISEAYSLLGAQTTPAQPVMDQIVYTNNVLLDSNTTPGTSNKKIKKFVCVVYNIDLNRFISREK